MSEDSLQGDPCYEDISAPTSPGERVFLESSAQEFNENSAPTSPGEQVFLQSSCNQGLVARLSSTNLVQIVNSSRNSNDERSKVRTVSNANNNNTGSDGVSDSVQNSGASRSGDGPFSALAKNSSGANYCGEEASTSKSSARKMAKAKKSCQTFKGKESSAVNDLSVNTNTTPSQLKSPISPTHSGIAKMSPGRSSGRARISFSNASFKLPNLENRLGLSFKSFSDLDAKTLDKMIMMRTNTITKKESSASTSSKAVSDKARLSGDVMVGDNDVVHDDTSNDDIAHDDGPTKQLKSTQQLSVQAQAEGGGLVGKEATRLGGGMRPGFGPASIKSKARKSCKSSLSISTAGFCLPSLEGEASDHSATAHKACSSKTVCEERGSGEELNEGGASLPVKRFKSACQIEEKAEPMAEGRGLAVRVEPCSAELFDSVTPPTTPTGSSDSDLVITGDEPLNPARYTELSCCCADEGIELNSFSSITINCQAIDSIDGKAVGCSSRVKSKLLWRVSQRVPFMILCETHRLRMTQHECCLSIMNIQVKSKLLWRVSHRVPFMILCEIHRLRMTQHECCPVCGLFCTQGEFVRCSSSVEHQHSFHSSCMALLNDRYECPHCCHDTPPLTTLLHQQPMQTASLFSQQNNSEADDIQAKISCPVNQRDCRKKKKKGCDSSSTTTESGASLQSNHDMRAVGLTEKDMATILAIMQGEKIKKGRLCVKSLHASCRSGDLERVAHLLSEGVDAQQSTDDIPYSPIHAAAKHGHNAVIELLIRFGGNVNGSDADLKTPLMYASEAGHCRTVQYLISAGASLLTKDSEGMTVLHVAAKAGHLPVVQLLLDTEMFDINAKDNGGWTPLVWATELDQHDTVKCLLRHGAQPNLSDVELNTGLHWACYSGNAQIALLYLNAGCGINCPNVSGDRPLHIAVRRDHVECVALLLRHRADVMATNQANETALMCCRNEKSYMYSLLKCHYITYGRAPERLLIGDISRGRENMCISVVNAVDDENYPSDFVYVTESVETFPLNINRCVTNLSACMCDSDCGLSSCPCSRQSIKCPYDKVGRLSNDFNTIDPPLIFECNRACRCLSTCQNRVAQMGITCRLEVFRTNGRGWGCRTLQDIPRGSFVCEYFGELITDAEAERRTDDSYLFDLDSQSPESDTFCIDAKHYGNVSRFINHLCDPNLIPIKLFIDHHDLRFPRMCFFASRDIKAYQELGFNYGERFWSIKWKQFTCKCESVRCRYSSETIRETLEEYYKRNGEDEEGERVWEDPSNAVKHCTN